MKQIVRRCPECGNRLLDENSCRCGWIQENKKNNVYPHRCCYQVGDRQCPMTGVLSDSITKSDRWFCRPHWQTRHDPQLARAVLLDIESDISFWSQQPTNWRKEMLEERLKNTKVIQNSVKKSIQDSILELRKIILQKE